MVAREMRLLNKPVLPNPTLSAALAYFIMPDLCTNLVLALLGLVKGVGALLDSQVITNHLA